MLLRPTPADDPAPAARDRAASEGRRRALDNPRVLTIAALLLIGLLTGTF